MRPWEVLLLVFDGFAALCLVMSRWRRVGFVFAVAAAVAALVHAAVEGAHWQMIPAYVATAALVLVPGVALWRGEAGGRGWQTAAGILAVLLLCGSLGMSWVLPMFRLPKPTGPYAVGTSLLYVRGEPRVGDGKVARELMVQVWYPAATSDKPLARYREPKETHGLSSYQSVLDTNSRRDAPLAMDGAPFPVILFNHGWGGRRTNDTFLTEELASHGYVVASIDHTGNASLVAFPDGRVVKGNAPQDIADPSGSTPERVKAIWNQELALWVADERLVLDRLEEMNGSAGTRWSGRLNTQLAGAIGHSFGGSAATEACATDGRVRAAVGMDGWFFNAIHARGEHQPLMYFDTSADHFGTIDDPSWQVARLDREDVADLKQSLDRFGGYVVTVEGAEHGDFTDEPLVSPLRKLSHRGRVPAPELERLMRSYVVAFFEKTLRGRDAEILHPGKGPFSEATIEYWPAGGQAVVPDGRTEAASLAR